MHSVVFGLIASLALLCAVIYSRMPNQSALIWLAAALACGGIETVALAGVVPTEMTVAAVSCLVPAAYLCLSQSIRALYRLPGTSWQLFATVAVLTLASLAMLATDAPAVVQAVPFQLGGAIALCDGILCLYRRRSDMLDNGLLLVLFVMAVVVLARIPFFPLLFDGAGAEAAAEQSFLQRVLLSAAMVTTPTSVFLIIAKVVTGIIAGHRERSERDYLTNLPNRRSFERAVAEASQVGGAMIVCDIDQFKQINDRYGHAVGDDIIRVFASLLQERPAFAARVGGEEFAMLLPGASAEEANARADDIRRRFHSLRHPALARDDRLSASFGVAGFDAGDSARSALLHADAALYRAKEEGRNRVWMHSEQPAPVTRQVA